MYYPLSKGATDACKLADEAGKHLALAEARKAGPVLAYGNFITVAINFLILALCIFIVVKMFNTARKRFEAQKPAPAPAPAGPSPSEKLLAEIRDELRASRR
jgi:large conductance mechanosensitive channel